MRNGGNVDLGGRGKHGGGGACIRMEKVHMAVRGHAGICRGYTKGEGI